jgi:hypothetical protein
MATKSYAERNAESIAKYGKSLYERRIESAQARGLSRSQARGHARIEKGEAPASTLRASRGTRAKPQKTPLVTPKKKPPKITQRFISLKNGTRVVTTRSTEQIARSLNGQVKKARATGRQKRIYFRVWDSKRGKYVSVYQGRPGASGYHGITVEEFMRRVDEKMSSGEAVDLDQAIRDTIAEDSAKGGGIDSPEGEEAPPDFEQVEMYIR